MRDLDWSASLPSLQAAPDQRLIEAVRRGDQGAVDSLLKQGVDVNGRQGDGATALHWAAHQNDRGMVERLLRAGADVQAANELGVTPLLLACTNGSAPIVEALAGRGADPNATAQGRETPLMVASWTGNADVVRRLLDARRRRERQRSVAPADCADVGGFRTSCGNRPPAHRVAARTCTPGRR